jgi:serine/threonine protein kinase
MGTSHGWYDVQPLKGREKESHGALLLSLQREPYFRSGTLHVSPVALEGGFDCLSAPTVRFRLVANNRAKKKRAGAGGASSSSSSSSSAAQNGAIDSPQQSRASIDVDEGNDAVDDVSDKTSSAGKRAEDKRMYTWSASEMLKFKVTEENSTGHLVAEVFDKKQSLGEVHFSVLECAELLANQPMPLGEAASKGGSSMSSRQLQPKLVSLKNKRTGATERICFSLQLNVSIPKYRSPELKTTTLSSQKKVLRVRLDPTADVFVQLGFKEMTTKAVAITPETTAIEMRDAVLRSVARGMSDEERADLLSRCRGFFIHEVSLDGSMGDRLLRTSERPWATLADHNVAVLKEGSTMRRTQSMSMVVAGTTSLSASTGGVQSPLAGSSSSSSSPTPSSSSAAADAQPVFGVPLEYVVQNQVGGDNVPRIVERCIEYLSRDVCLRQQGMFRISANQRAIERLMCIVDAGDVDVELPEADSDKADASSVHLVAGLLKRFFIDLPDPLFPAALYQSTLEAATLADVGERIAKIRLVIDRMPVASQCVLESLLRFLPKLAEHSDVNMMTATNIGICWGVTMIRSEGDDPMKIMADSTHINALMASMIENSEVLFGVRHVAVEQLYSRQEPIGGCHVFTFNQGNDPFIVDEHRLESLRAMSPATLERRLLRLKHHCHKNLLQVVNVCVDDERGSLFIVHEFAQGSLFKMVASAISSYSEIEAVRLSKQLVLAVDALHSKSMPHGGINPDSLFCSVTQRDDNGGGDAASSVTAAAATTTASGGTGDGSEKKDVGELSSWTLKLSGAGVAKTLLKRSYLPGAVGFTAPEVLEQGDSDTCSKSADMWSAGCVVFALLTGTEPFAADSADAIKQRVLSAPSELDFSAAELSGVSNSAKHFLGQLLKREPSKRLSCQAALQHPWLRVLGGQASQTKLDIGTNLRGTLDLRAILSAKTQSNMV